MKNKALLADSGMLLVTIIWGYGFIATKVAINSYTASQILLMRFFLGALILSAASIKYLKTITKKDVINCAISGFVLYGGFIFQTVAVNYTTVAKNAFLTTLSVIFVPIIVAVVDKEKIDKYSITGCILAILGTGILSLNVDFTINFGDMLSIICAVFFSFHVYLQSKFVKQTPTNVLVTGKLMFATVFSFITAAFLGELDITYVSAEGALGILYLAVMSTSVCFFIQAKCQKYASPIRMVIIFSLEAVFASIFAVVLLGDTITMRFLLGSSVIFAAVIITSTKLAFLKKTDKIKSEGAA